MLRGPRQARASFPSPPHFAVAQTSWPQPLSRRQCLPNSWIIKTQPKLALLLSTDPACGGILADILQASRKLKTKFVQVPVTGMSCLFDPGC